MASKPPVFTPRESFEAGPFWKIHHLEVPNDEARIALSFAERWAMVAAVPDGEDAAGRQKLRPMTPAELVQRACQSAEAIWSEFEKRGWIVNMPTPQEAEAELLKKRADRKSNRE